MLSLRMATIDDMQQYFDWANDKVVRQNSLNVKTINWEEHRKWFKGKLNNKDSFLYLAEIKNNQIGQVRFECKDNEAMISYSISDDFRGQGLGEIILKQGIERFNQDCSYIKIIKAKAKINNIASNKILIRASFIKQDKTDEMVVYQLMLPNAS